MAKFTLRKRINALALKKSDLKDFLNLMAKIVEKDNANQEYKRTLELSIDCPGDLRLDTSSPEEFINFLGGKKRIRMINIEYFGNNVSFDFSAYEYCEPTIMLKTTDKGDLLGIEDDIRRILKNNSWNNIFHLSWAIFPFGSMFAIIIFSLLRSLHLVNNNISLYFFSSMLGLILSLPFLIISMKIYPCFVLEEENVSSGRIFKKDLKWIIGFVILTFLGGWLYDIMKV